MPTNYTYVGVNNTIQRLVVVSPSWLSTGRIQIPLYTTILLLAVTGNALVILTLVQNRRMRTITNVFLLNLAVSDILLGVLCMPFTLIGTLLRDFVFGEIMCKFLPYLQATSVAVSAWTLVAISCERYYAICHPLSSRRWQTLKHAYKSIGLIWFGSFLFMSPIAALSRLIPTSQGVGGQEECPELFGSVFSMNGAKCLIFNEKPVCDCIDGYFGARCEGKQPNQQTKKIPPANPKDMPIEINGSPNGTDSTIAWTVAGAVAIIALAALGIAAYVFIRTLKSLFLRIMSRSI